jgi:molybdopterin synthase catalytic subunit
MCDCPFFGDSAHNLTWDSRVCLDTRDLFISEPIYSRVVEFLGSVGIHSRGDIKVEQVMDEVRRHPESKRAGAMVTFVGIVREDPVESSGGKVTYLEYEAFEEVAVQKLQELRNELTKREGVVDVSIHHVVDRLRVGEDSLIIVVLGTHRRFVFSVLEEAVERVKKEVPIWKKEFTSESAYWVENTSTRRDSEASG